MSDSKKSQPFQQLLRVSDLPTRKPTRFEVTPEAEVRQAIAEYLGLLDLKKLRFEGTLTARGPEDWVLNANLGATVVQPCVVTLEPVVTRIDEPVERSYVRDLPETDPTEEAEIPEDVDVELLKADIDLGAAMIEVLALALPAYPKAPGAELGEVVHAAPGVTPIKDEDLRPFAGLAGLRDKLKKDD